MQPITLCSKCLFKLTLKTVRSIRLPDPMRQARNPQVLCRWYFDQFNMIHTTASLSGMGSLELTLDGRVNVKASFKGLVGNPYVGAPLKLTGATKNGHSLEIEQAHLSRVDFVSQSNVLFKTLGCKINKPGHPLQGWTSRHYWLKNIRCFGTGTFQVAGYTFTLEPLPGFDLNRAEPGYLNADLKVTSPIPTTDDISELVDDICYLLSLAQRSFIGWVRLEVSDGTTGGYLELRELTQDHPVQAPLVDFFAQDICDFVVQVFPNFVRQKTSYSLRILIEHYWRAHVETYAEVKFIFGSVFMETLKFDWAKNVGTTIYQPRTGQNGLIKGFRRPGSGRDTSFEDLLVEMSKSLNYPAQMSISAQGSNPGQPGTFTFIDNRNALFHSGQSGATQLGHSSVWQYLKPEMHRLYDQMDDLFLRVLGYSGKIHRTSKPNTLVNFP